MFHQQVSKLAATLVAQGVKKGDRVLIYMPMIPEAVAAMLAVVRIGAVHSLVFGGSIRMKKKNYFLFCLLIRTCETQVSLQESWPSVFVTLNQKLLSVHLVEWNLIE